ncbi:MAG: hypothetical protein K2J13_03850, partial [Clostridia bacterium]|nr:hypothetical protein [Clostridia bacterium]
YTKTKEFLLEEIMEEEQYTEELTFKKIWEKIKISGVRIIVYALIGLILAIAVLGVCRIIMTKSQYETRITYYYSGIEEGNDPWGGYMKPVQDIKSASIVRNALAVCGYDDETIDKLVNNVIKNLSVVPTMSNEQVNEDKELLSANYNYRIILAQNSEIDKYISSKNEYNTIVSAITEEYINSFKAKFSMDTKLPTIQKIGADEKVNTMQELDILSQNINTFSIESASWQAKTGNFISSDNKMSFATLTAQITGLSLELNKYETYVLTNAIDGNGERDYIETNIAKFTTEEDAKRVQVENLNQTLQNATPNITPSLQSEPIVLTGTDTKDLLEKIIKVSDELANATKNKGIWSKYKEAYDNGSASTEDGNYDTAVAMANGVIDRYNSLIETYKGMIKDYNEGYSVNSLVRVTSGATQTNASPLSTMSSIIILAVVVILAVIIAMCVTSKKGAMRIKLLESKKAQSEAEQATESADEASVADESESKE